MSKQKRPVFHPRTPAKLRRLWKEFPAYHRLAKHLGVNVAPLWALMVKGRAPSDSNPDLRERLGLPRRERKARAVPTAKAELPDYLRWWRKLGKEERGEWIRSAFDQVGEL